MVTYVPLFLSMCFSLHLRKVGPMGHGSAPNLEGTNLGHFLLLWILYQLCPYFIKIFRLPRVLSSTRMPMSTVDVKSHLRALRARLRSVRDKTLVSNLIRDINESPESYQSLPIFSLGLKEIQQILGLRQMRGNSDTELKDIQLRTT